MRKYLDLSKEMPAGATYENTYGQFLEIFRTCSGKSINNPPKSWIPLLMYLNCDVDGEQEYFPEDILLPNNMRAHAYLADDKGLMRAYVEHVCALRPELVDALWKADNQWTWRDDKTEVIHEYQKDFKVTTYNSFFRPEIRLYLDKLHDYRTTHKKCVLTNCAADKPYPSPLHLYLKEKYPTHELVICTGVLGVLPEALWNEAPHYDSGMPNFWRMQEELTLYLRNNRYDEIVVHTEFNQQSILKVLPYLAPDSRIIFAVPYQRHTDYIDLTKF